MSAPSIRRKPLLAIVDDHDLFRKATARVLEGKGFETRAFGSVAEFIHSGLLSKVHCLILDINMPEIDGIALQEGLRVTKYDLPIVFCSGTENEKVRARALAGGAVSVLKKPVSSGQLVDAIEKAVAHSHAAHSHAEPRHAPVHR
jgi:FixJ family two-component response regulator